MCILINLNYLPHSSRILDRHLADVTHMLKLSKDTKIYLTSHVAVSSTARGDYFSKLKELPLRVFFHMLVNAGEYSLSVVSECSLSVVSECSLSA